MNPSPPGSDGSRRPQHIDPETRPRFARLEGERVTLRPLEEADLAAVAAALSKPGAAEWWPVTSLDGLRADVLDDDDAVALAVEADGRVVGILMYEESLWRDYFHASLDIGLDPDLRGQGLGPGALRLLISWLIDVGGHHRLQLDPAAANTSAIRAYEKVGFKPVGIMRRYELGPDGSWRDSLLMDLLADEFVRDPDANHHAG